MPAPRKYPQELRERSVRPVRGAIYDLTSFLRPDSDAEDHEVISGWLQG